MLRLRGATGVAAGRLRGGGIAAPPDSASGESLFGTLGRLFELAFAVVLGAVLVWTLMRFLRALWLRYGGQGGRAAPEGRP